MAPKRQGRVTFGRLISPLRPWHVLLGVVLLGVLIVSFGVARRPAPAYQYPDLPLQWEEIIRTESDCGRLREINAGIGGWQFDAGVKLDAWGAVEHRAELIGCDL